MNFRQPPELLFATGLGVGYMPVAPGTFGTLLGLPLCFGLSLMDLPYAALCSAGLIAVAIWTAHEAEKILDRTDPGCIVADEIAGMVVTLLGLPFTLKTAVLGFLVFRLLDIVKPPPVRYLEEHFKGGLGVVLDDVAAGVIGNLMLRLVFSVTGI